MWWMAKAFSARVEEVPAVDKKPYRWDTTSWVGWQYGVGMILLLFLFCFHSGRFDCLFYPLAVCSLFSFCFPYVLFCSVLSCFYESICQFSLFQMPWSGPPDFLDQNLLVTSYWSFVICVYSLDVCYVPVLSRPLVSTYIYTFGGLCFSIQWIKIVKEYW